MRNCFRSTLVLIFSSDLSVFFRIALPFRVSLSSPPAQTHPFNENRMLDAGNGQSRNKRRKMAQKSAAFKGENLTLERENIIPRDRRKHTHTSKKQLGNANYLYFIRFSCFVYTPAPISSSDVVADHLSRISLRRRLPKMS